jgi:hypothetical protein
MLFRLRRLAPAETGDIMIAIDRMKAGSPPAGFTFARTGRGGESEWTVVEDVTARDRVTRFDRIGITTLPHGD